MKIIVVTLLISLALAAGPDYSMCEGCDSCTKRISIPMLGSHHFTTSSSCQDYGATVSVHLASVKPGEDKFVVFILDDANLSKALTGQEFSYYVKGSATSPVTCWDMGNERTGKQDRHLNVLVRCKNKLGDCQLYHNVEFFCSGQLLNSDTVCASQELVCGDMCLPYVQVCDGVSDCANGEDEHDCGFCDEAKTECEATCAAETKAVSINECYGVYDDYNNVCECGETTVDFCQVFIDECKTECREEARPVEEVSCEQTATGYKKVCRCEDVNSGSSETPIASDKLDPAAVFTIIFAIFAVIIVGIAFTVWLIGRRTAAPEAPSVNMTSTLGEAGDSPYKLLQEDEQL